MVFICISPVTNDTEYFFRHLLDIWTISSAKWSNHQPVLKIELIAFFSCWLIGFKLFVGYLSVSLSIYLLSVCDLSAQSLSRVWLFATPWTTACQASLSITNCPSLPKPLSKESLMPSNHLILHRPLLLPSIFPSIRVFSNESALRIRWPKYWSFSFNISPFNEHSGLISFSMDWLDLPAVQGTLKSLLQHHSSKASIIQHSALFIVQLSHPYMTTGKTIALTRWIFVGKVMSLLFNMLSRLVITCPFTKLINFKEVKFISLSFYDYLFHILFKKYLTALQPWRCSPMFSSEALLFYHLSLWFSWS